MMADFFGSVFKALGGLIKGLSVLWGLFLLLVFSIHGSESGQFIFWMVALLAGIPYLTGVLLSRIGAHLQEKDPESLMPPQRGRETTGMGEDRDAVPRISRRLAPVRSDPRPMPEPVDVDNASPPEPANADNAPPPRRTPAVDIWGRQKPDETAMGVTEFIDPDKKGTA